MTTTQELYDRLVLLLRRDWRDDQPINVSTFTCDDGITVENIQTASINGLAKEFDTVVYNDFGSGGSFGVMDG